MTLDECEAKRMPWTKQTARIGISRDLGTTRIWASKISNCGAIKQINIYNNYFDIKVEYLNEIKLYKYIVY